MSSVGSNWARFLEDKENPACARSGAGSTKSGREKDLNDIAEPITTGSSASNEGAVHVAPQTEVNSSERQESRTGIPGPTCTLSRVGIVEPYRRLWKMDSGRPR